MEKAAKIYVAGHNGMVGSAIVRKLEKEGKVEKGTADMMRNRYHKSHSKIKGDWKKNRYSANNLAMHLLW